MPLNRLTLTTLWANSADDKLMICIFYFFFIYLFLFIYLFFFFFFGVIFFSRKQGLTFHANCLHCIRDNLHEMSKPVF